MITAVRNFFSQFIEPGAGQAVAISQHALQVATAALLLETMRMDSSITPEETSAVAVALQKQFGMDSAEIDTLLDLAGEEARQASGYHQFTSLINKGFNSEQKGRVIEYMWEVAYADDHLHAHEQHLIRKIADLLYVSHADYIAAKQRARTAADKSAAPT